MQAQAYGWPVAPAWGVGDVVSGTDPTDQPLTSSVTALGGTQKKQKKNSLKMSSFPHTKLLRTKTKICQKRAADTHAAPLLI